MAIKYKKDWVGCIAHTKIEIKYFPKHYYRVFLWRNLDALRDNVANPEEVSDTCGGLCVHATYFSYFDSYGHQYNRARRYMGELHFLHGTWDTDTVAHECYHATNNICKVLNIQPQLRIEYEELAAYIHGELVHDVYCWLWKVSPPTRDWNLWKRIKGIAFGKW